MVFTKHFLSIVPIQSPSDSDIVSAPIFCSIVCQLGIIVRVNVDLLSRIVRGRAPLFVMSL